MKILVEFNFSYGYTKSVQDCFILLFPKILSVIKKLEFLHSFLLIL